MINKKNLVINIVAIVGSSVIGQCFHWFHQSTIVLVIGGIVFGAAVFIKWPWINE